jgi:glycosyltransferase involved in cell wall biosynthesis
VAGELRQSTGLAEAARVFQRAAQAAGVLAGTVTVGVGQAPAGAAAPGAALLLAVNAPSLPLMLARAPQNFLRGRRVIATWAWELPAVPPSWRVGARYVHEVWACSDFTAAALEAVMPGRVRVVPYPLAVAPPAPVAADRAAFGLPDGAVVTLMVFSLGSSFTRKNPVAGIAAFRRAFGDRADQILVVKFAGAAAYPREAAALRAAASGAKNVRFFGEAWPAERVAGLMACADIVLSLHRAEGFGLVPAAAMLSAIPVIATGWSGNLAFMDAGSAALVRFSLVPVADPGGIYQAAPGVVWAEPDVGHAVELLRHLGDDAAARAALGAAGQAHATQALDGAAMRTALAANGVKGQGALPPGQGNRVNPARRIP